MNVFLGVDQGSSSTKALLVTGDGEIVWRESISISTNFPGEYLVEQDPIEILNSCSELIDASLVVANQKRLNIVAMGFAVQRSSVLAWDSKTFVPLSPLLSWRDSRMRESASFKRAWSQRDEIYARTNMMPAPGYAASKLAYLQKEYSRPGIAASTLEAFLLTSLGIVSSATMEESMAHRTLLYCSEARQWSEELCAIFEVCRAALPSIHPSLGLWGEYRGIPVLAVLGDQQAALFALRSSGFEAKTLLNLGTIGSLIAPREAGVPLPDRFLGSIFHSSKEAVCSQVEATVNACGKTLSLALELARELSAQSRVGYASPFAYCPFGELTTPVWRGDISDRVSPGFYELTKDQQAAVLLESLGNFLIKGIEVFKSNGLITSQYLPVTGGGAGSNYLLQYLADCTGLTITRVSLKDSTAIGAALAAAQQKGESAHVAFFSEQEFTQQDFGRYNERYLPWLHLEAQLLSGDTSTSIPFHELS